MAGHSKPPGGGPGGFDQILVSGANRIEVFMVYPRAYLKELASQTISGNGETGTKRRAAVQAAQREVARVLDAAERYSPSGMKAGAPSGRSRARCSSRSIQAAGWRPRPPPAAARQDVAAPCGAGSALARRVEDQEGAALGDVELWQVRTWMACLGTGPNGNWRNRARPAARSRPRAWRRDPAAAGSTSAARPGSANAARTRPRHLAGRVRCARARGEAGMEIVGHGARPLHDDGRRQEGG